MATGIGTLDTIAAAATELDTVWSTTCAWEAADHYTCAEIDALAELLRAVGLSDLADRMVEGHAEGDDEGDDHYTGDDSAE